jgi:hypothetical protein
VTAQISDRVDCQGEAYALVRASGEGLFDPAAYGLQPVMLHTACWRGFLCTYQVGEDGWLRLRQLTIRLEDEPMQAAARGELTLLGRQPTVGGELVFEDLGEVAFTGGLLLGADFVQELYVHMGFHPAWKYGRLRELVFEAGRLQEDLDHSAAAAELRESFARATSQSDPSGDVFRQQREAERAWSQRTFRRDYG